jgi:hypothetical protein
MFPLEDLVLWTVNFYMCYCGWQTDWINDSVGNVMAIVEPLYNEHEDLDIQGDVFRAILENLQWSNVNRVDFDWAGHVNLWCVHFLRGKGGVTAPAA